MQHLLHADGGGPVLQGCAPVAAHEDDRNIRPQESDLASELSAYKLRHSLIGKNYVETLRICRKSLQRQAA